MLVAAAQLSPVLLDRDATVERAIAAIPEASAHSARLIVFPEAFVPGYPVWVWSIPAGDTHALRALYVELLRESVSVPDEATERLCRAARDARMLVVIGVNERNSEASNTSLFNSALFIDADGRLLGTLASSFQHRGSAWCTPWVTARHSTCTTRPWAGSAG